MRVGVTGHQDLLHPAWVAAQIRNALHEASPLVGVSSLAVGADQLFAEVVVTSGGILEVVLPFADYDRTFEPEALPRYKSLLRKAAHVRVLDFCGTDQERYLAAGQEIVQRVDWLIAVWNGQPAAGLGGTADIIAFARKLGRPGLHINPVTRTVTPLD